MADNPKLTPPGAVIVTGASSGIGLATSVELARRGYQVFATMRDPRRRQALDAAAARDNVGVRVAPLDVTDEASIQAALATVVDEAGSIYGLVNNAGIQVRGFFEDVAEDEVRRIFETNFFGTLAMTRAALPRMAAAGKGRIVIVSSVTGRLGMVGLTAYAAAKFALSGFAEALALETAPLGLSVSLVEPALVRTQMWADNRTLAAQASAAASPYRRWFEELERLTNRLVDQAPTTSEDVAGAIARALEAKRPRLHYVVGGRARALVALRRLLPGDTFDRLHARLMQKRVTRPEWIG